MTVLLDTTQIDSEHRSSALHALLTQASAPHELRLHGDPALVRARLEHWQLNEDVSILRQESSGITHTRDDRHTRMEGPGRVVFVLHDGGPGRYIHEGDSRRLNRGGLYATDLNSHYSYSRPGDGVARILQVERSSLGLSIEQVQEASTRLFASPLYDLLRHHVADLCAAAPELDHSGESRSVARATVQLASSMLLTALASERPDARDAAQDYLSDRVSLYIELNYADDLTPTKIAAAHGISLRYLYKVWAERPESLSEQIMRARLDAARRLIESSEDLPIGLVAAKCGFTNPSYFSRRFRAAFGCTPTDLRAAVRSRSGPATST